MKRVITLVVTFYFNSFDGSQLRISSYAAKVTIPSNVTKRSFFSSPKNVQLFLPPLNPFEVFTPDLKSRITCRVSARDLSNNSKFITTFQLCSK